MKTLLKILLFVVGFPALIALSIIAAMKVVEQGSSYGFWVYAGIILVGVFFLAYLITFIVTEVKYKKSKTVKAAKKGMISLVLVAFIFTAGIWFVVDTVLPGILQGATADTLLFGDLKDNYEEQAEINGALLTKFITLNYNNGNLDNTDEDGNEIPLETYLNEGYKNAQIKKMIHANFQNMDQNGYASYTATGPWIGFANDSRLTIPVLIHLLFNEREINADLPYYLKNDYIPRTVTIRRYNSDRTEIIETPTFTAPKPRPNPEGGLTWAVLDMDGNPMTLSIGALFESMDPGLRLLALPLIEQIGPSIIQSLRNVVADEAVAGAPIYLAVHLDYVEMGNSALVLRPSNESRGMHGYQNSAWLNSNHLLFAVISVFPIRYYLYAWGAIVIAMSVAIGAINISRAKDKKEADADIEYDGSYEQDYYGTDDFKEPQVMQYDDSDIYDDKSLSPYEKAYIIAQRDRQRRL